MKKTINLHKVHHLSGGVDVDAGYTEEFNSVEDARSAGEDFAKNNDDYSVEIVIVCDDVDDARYCKIVEVIETIA